MQIYDIIQYLTHNQVVPGSSPGGPTIKNPCDAGVFYWLFHFEISLLKSLW